MEDLINFINTGNCFALIGAGPSCEIGLPSWKNLAKSIYDEMVTEKLEINSFMQEYISREEFPKFFNEIWHKHGQDWLIRKIKERVKDNGVEGKIYNYLAQFAFQSYFTTNYDNILTRHLTKAKKTHLTLLNTKEDLERFDPSTLLYIVKIHGDCSSPDSIILTDDQYNNYQHKGEHLYYREFLKSHLIANKFFVVGYSFNDPYIIDILKTVTANFRRRTPIYAILSDIKNSQINELDSRCNIKVIPYSNKSGTHKELVSIFETISKFIRTDKEAIIKREEIDLKRAQSLYMWHKFQFNGKTDEQNIDSMKSILLTIIYDNYKGKTFVKNELLSNLSKFLGVKSELFQGIIDDALVDLVKTDFISFDGNKNYSPKDRLIQLVNKYNKLYDDLLNNYLISVKNEFEECFTDISKENSEQVVNASLDIIIDMFSERAVEIINMIFEKRPIIIQQADNLFKLINLRAKEITNQQIRFKFIQYISEMLTKPSKIQEAILEYYSKAYFSIQALQIDPLGNEFKKSFLTDRTILVDSNVIIPLLADSCLDCDFFNDVIRVCQINNIQLITTENLIDEVFFHACWAKKLVNESGEQSISVLSAAMGNYPYKRNAFLDGFIRYSTTKQHVTFDEYLTTIFGEELTHKEIIKKYLIEKYSITCLSMDKFGTSMNDLLYEKEKVLDYIEQKADENRLDKSTHRNKSEAEAYVFIRNWALIDGNKGKECSFLSQGGFLNKIARESEYSIKRNIVIRPDALYEFMIRLAPKIEKQMPFKDVLISTYFRSAEYFVDHNKYRDFFSTLINRAEQAYKKGLQDFQKNIDGQLHTSSIDEYFDLEKPLFVYSLEEGLKDRLHESQNKVAELKILVDIKDFELKETNQRLEKINKKEENKRKYAAKQRKMKLKKKRRK